VFHSAAKDQTQEMLNAEQTLVDKGWVQDGDTIVITVGEAVGKAGHTNTMKIVRVGDHRKG
jgi:pyruvate kinase